MQDYILELFSNVHDTKHNLLTSLKFILTNQFYV